MSYTDKSAFDIQRDRLIGEIAEVKLFLPRRVSSAC